MAVAACTATALLSGQVSVTDISEKAYPKVSEELVYARTKDGNTIAGALFRPGNGPARPTAVIWIHGSTENFYNPTYVKIARELAGRGFAVLSGNTRMHDLGNIAGVRGEARVRGGVYWGKYSEQVHDLAAWVDFAELRGFKDVILAGHSAGTTAVQGYQAQTEDVRVVGIVLASGRFKPGAAPDPDRVAQAKKMVEEGLGEALLPNPGRPTSFVSAATLLDLATMGPMLRDFYGVQTPNPPVTRIRCPILAWFGTKEPDIGTAADLDLLKSAIKKLNSGPSSVVTTMIQNAGHMYSGEEAQVAETIARWADRLERAGNRNSTGPNEQ